MINNSFTSKDLSPELQKQIDFLYSKIKKNEKLAKKKLKIDKLKYLDFYNIEGLRIIKMFVVFESISDKNLFYKSFNEVII